MAARYIYVKASGTATGSAGAFSSLQTGAYTNATSYATIASAITNAVPILGDYILLSDSEDVTTTTPTALGVNGCTIMSIADANRDTYAAGAIWRTTGGTDMVVSVTNGTVTLVGINIIISDDSRWTSDGSGLYLVDCTIDMPTTSSDQLNASVGKGAVLRFKDCALNIDDAAGSGLQGGYLSRVIIDNCTNSILARSELMENVVDYGADVRIINTDLTDFISASGSVLGDALVAEERIEISIERCKLPSGFTFNSASNAAGQNFTYSISESDVGDGYHYFFLQNPTGQVEEDTTQYLDATYDGVNGFSAQIDTTAIASKGRPFRYKLATLPGSDLATANQTISLEIVGPSGLRDADVWIEIVHGNDTDEAKGDILTTQPANKIGAGTALTSSSQIWQVTTDTEYSISKDLGAFTNTDNTNLEIYLHVAKPSITLNADMPTLAAT